MTEKVKDVTNVREPTLPAAENATTLPPEKIAPTAPPPLPEEAAESKIADSTTAEAVEVPVVAKVPAPKIERTEEQMRHAALTASQEWHVARAPQGDIFSRRIGAAQATYRQVFNELDRRPMPTYKPGEPLDPLLELRENPRLLQSALDEMYSIRRRLAHLPVVVRPREGDEPRIVTVADTYLKAADSRWDGDWVVWFLEEVQKADPLTLRELWAFPTAVKFLLVEEVLTQAKTQIEDPDAFDLARARTAGRAFRRHPQCDLCELGADDRGPGGLQRRAAAGPGGRISADGFRQPRALPRAGVGVSRATPTNRSWRWPRSHCGWPSGRLRRIRCRAWRRDARTWATT